MKTPADYKIEALLYVLSWIEAKRIIIPRPAEYLAALDDIETNARAAIFRPENGCHLDEKRKAQNDETSQTQNHR